MGRPSNKHPPELRDWVAAHRERTGTTDADELTGPERARLKQLEKENRELRMDNFSGKVPVAR